MSERIDRVLVWGNCQAAPLAALLRRPLAEHGLHVEPTVPVYLADDAELRRVHDLLPRCALLVSQPVSDTYRVPGCSTAQLAAQLPRESRLLRVPAVYDTAPFPFQVRGYDPRGRVDAPVTDYHDLRMLLAADRGLGPRETLRRWAPTGDADGRLAAASLAELRRRETSLDVTVSDLVRRPDSLWTITHPSNTLLAALARRILAALGMSWPFTAEPREFLGQRRAPIDAELAERLGWTPRTDWVVDDERVPLDQLIETQLTFYVRRPDVIGATLRRNSSRVRLLGLR